MTLKHLLLFILSFALSTSYAQEKEIDYLAPENRSGQLFFKLSSEYRITPLPYNQPVKSGVSVNPDLQNSGVAFAYSLDMFITKNLSLGFSNSFRYDYLGGFEEFESDLESSPTNRGLIIGYHFYIDYHFKIFSESELYLRIGRSIINSGTSIDSQKTFFNTEGEILFIERSSEDYAYEPYNLGIGWKKKKIEIMLGLYTTTNSEYFLESTNFRVPYLKFSYNLGRL